MNDSGGEQKEMMTMMIIFRKWWSRKGSNV